MLQPIGAHYQALCLLDTFTKFDELGSEMRKYTTWK